MFVRYITQVTIGSAIVETVRGVINNGSKKMPCSCSSWAEPDMKRLLFVDDEPGIRATLSVILQQHGFDVRVAASVSEALQTIETNDLDVLLSDMNIDEPGDGYRVVRAMRKVNPNSVAIILTGYPEFETAVQGIQEKIDDYLVKPADVDLLIARLEQRLAERNSHL